MGTKTVQPVTNEDLLEVIKDHMQMTSDGFIRLETRMDRVETRMDKIEWRMDRIETRMDSIETRMGSIEDRMVAIERKLSEHALQLAELKQITQQLANNHVAYMHDIKDILDRITALEKRAPAISQKEVRAIQKQLQTVVNWAMRAAKVISVPLHLGP